MSASQRVSLTDPPYYDNIGYADLSDFFYVWLRRALGPCYPTCSVPAHAEGGGADRVVHTASMATRTQHEAFFEHGLGHAFDAACARCRTLGSR